LTKVDETTGRISTRPKSKFLYSFVIFVFFLLLPHMSFDALFQSGEEI